MKRDDALQFGPLPRSTRHLCVDMQRLFAEETDWHTPWMERVVPVIVRIVEAHAAQTIFTRFVPAEKPGEGEGAWRRYYERWASMTLDRLGRDRVELVPELARFVPPAKIFDKRVYSPWVEGDLHDRLRETGVDALVMTGGEIDVCVLAAVLGAVDRGYRVVLATDALCSSSDETYDAMLTLFHRRYGQQVETATANTILRNWS